MNLAFLKLYLHKFLESKIRSMVLQQLGIIKVRQLVHIVISSTLFVDLCLRANQQSHDNSGLAFSCMCFSFL